MPDPRSTTEHLAAIVDDLADPEPVPASGAAAVGAVGMALGLAIQATHKPRQGALERLAEQRAALTTLRDGALPLLTADCEAFERALRAETESAPAAFREAIAVPLAVVDVAVAGITVIDAMRADVRPALANDVAAARTLLIAGAVISLDNARANRDLAHTRSHWNTADPKSAALDQRLRRAGNTLGTALGRPDGSV